jgi:phospholipid N-methyltransferase
MAHLHLHLHSRTANAFLSTTKVQVNRMLAPMGIRIAKADGHDWSDTANYIPFQGTIDAANRAALSIGDYVDSVMNGVPGSSQSTIDKMASLGVFSKPMQTIVEIGPGTGRYLEKTLKTARPQRYEIYETARSWAEYLVETHQVIHQRTDGYTLSKTADQSADMVHAHKVFCGVPFMVTCCYLHEIVRAVRVGGWAVFDVLTERCLEGDAMQVWARSGIRNGAYPAVMPRELTVNFFARHGFDLAGSFILPMNPGTTELLAFNRTKLSA